MFNRRKFLAGLVAGPALALAGDEPPPCQPGNQTIWVIVGVNWAYNDDVNYPEGEYLTQHAFADKAAADQTCEKLIQDFRNEENPSDFLACDMSPPDGWDDWSRNQKWDWLLGCGPEPPPAESADDDGYGWVAIPFTVCEMRLPASARTQIATAANGT